MASIHAVIKLKHFPRYWPFVWGIDRHRWIPITTRSFDVFFDLRLNKQFRKQWERRWFETPARSLWRHSNKLNKSLSCPGITRKGLEITSCLTVGCNYLSLAQIPAYDNIFLYIPLLTESLSLDQEPKGLILEGSQPRDLILKWNNLWRIRH